MEFETYEERLPINQPREVSVARNNATPVGPCAVRSAAQWAMAPPRERHSKNEKSTTDLSTTNSPITLCFPSLSPFSKVKFIYSCSERASAPLVEWEGNTTEIIIGTCERFIKILMGVLSCCASSVCKKKNDRFSKILLLKSCVSLQTWTKYIWLIEKLHFWGQVKQVSLQL